MKSWKMASHDSLPIAVSVFCLAPSYPPPPPPLSPSRSSNVLSFVVHTCGRCCVVRVFACLCVCAFGRMFKRASYSFSHSNNGTHQQHQQQRQQHQQQRGRVHPHDSIMPARGKVIRETFAFTQWASCLLWFNVEYYTMIWYAGYRAGLLLL